MKVLAVDTSGPAVSVAVLDGDRTLAEAALLPGRSRSEHLVGLLDFLLTRLEMAPSEADLYVAVSGPGSFTGLRVGIGTVRGLALASGRPAVGIPTLQAMAASLGNPGGRLAPLLDAGRGEVYAGLYSGERGTAPLRLDAVIRPAALASFLADGDAAVFGSGADRYPEAIPATGARLLSCRMTLAAPAARFALERIGAGSPVTDWPLTARYVRRSDARLPGGSAPAGGDGSS